MARPLRAGHLHLQIEPVQAAVYCPPDVASCPSAPPSSPRAPVGSRCRARRAQADIISAVEFDYDGLHLATGDRGGRVVLFERVNPHAVSGAARERPGGPGLDQVVRLIHRLTEPSRLHAYRPC